MSRTPDGTGTVAVVTGAARGIGAAVALRLAAGGATVVVVDREERDTAGTVAAVRRAGGRALGIGCDVAVAAEVRTAMLRIAAAYGRLDILVNCAGVTRDRLLLAMDDPEWDTVLDVSLGGTMRWSLAAAELMKHRGTGRIVTFSSVAADGNPGQSNYATAKAALAGFTRALASELGPHGITVNAVAPGFVATPMVAELADRLGVDREAFLKEAASHAAVGRVGTVDDIAAVVAFLTGRDSGYLTGQTVSVDGGRR
ncbi:short-chain dehydrogenase/reductase SDR [Catenulispora acidiphila DSM 44928]|uniref:Short-chain dehydrogenase/reductase SDR n=1 Tax=Catenulispora acidiphila (strain DSM 44928 / JCM 14897 / NBRC 102108 / NRRL B-24433 / ID139908) TaxID=479433 RepID=C7PZH8_CATAD|nr:SDR family oxidoreductase [Catenulispora acidiphila]ACU71635.1 short-chain dehydrogenase/reductase SDR [Catenulispora acidiphila DSM 44928]